MKIPPLLLEKASLIFQPRKLKDSATNIENIPTTNFQDNQISINPQTLLLRKQINQLEELSKAGADTEKLEFYLDLVSYHIEKGFHTDELFVHFKELLSKNLSNEKWSIAKDGIEYQKKFGTKLDYLLNTYTSILSNEYFSSKYLSVYRSGFSYYRKSNLDLNSLSILFSKAMDARLDNKQLKILEKVLSTLKQYNDCSEVSPEILFSLTCTHTSPKRLDFRNLRIFFDAVKKLQKEKLGDLALFMFATDFTNLIRTTSSNGELKTLVDTNVKYVLESHKKGLLTTSSIPLVKFTTNLTEWKDIEELLADLNAYYKKNNWEVKEDLIKLSIQFIMLKPTDETSKLLQALIEYYKKNNWNVDNLMRSYMTAINYKVSYYNLEFLTKSLIPLFNGSATELDKFTEKYIEYTKNTELSPVQELTKWGKAVISYLQVGDIKLPLAWKFSSLLEANLTPEQWKVYYDMLEQLQEKGIEPSIRINHDFATLVKKGASLEGLKVYKNAISFEGFSENDLRLIFNYCNYLLENNQYPAMLENYNKAVGNKTITTKKEATKLLIEISTHTAIWNLTKNESPLDAQRFIMNAIRSDHVPYPQTISTGKVHPLAAKTYEETKKTYARIFDFYHGFSSLTFEAKKPPGEELSLLARFGKDLADFTGLINAGTSSDFPGRGVFISGLNIKKIFVEDLILKEKGLDPLQKYKDAFPIAKDEFEDLPLTDFIFTRGFIAVSSKSGEKYNLDGINYSYIVFNDHHHNYGCDIAFLIPTKVLYEKLKGTIISLDNLKLKPKKDINQAGFTPKELCEASSLIPANVLNLGWGSNIGGSFSNAYPPDSSPFHKWETSLRKEKHTRDEYGHIHKSHITGFPNTNMTPAMDEKLKPLRKAHEQVHAITNSYQNLLDLFRSTQSLYHKGFTQGQNINTPNTIIEVLEEFEDDDEENEDNEREIELVNQTQDNSWRDNPGTFRMLVEAYKWHMGGKLQNITDRNFYPVLAIADTMRYSTKPNTEILFDTYDMVLKYGENKFDFVTDIKNLTGTEKDIWLTEVMEHALWSSQDLRFYDRRDLGVL